MNKLQPKTILKRKSEALIKFSKIKRAATKEIDDADIIKRLVLRGLAKRCPHTMTHHESGQYLPCIEICDICGGKKGTGDSEFKLSW